MEEKRLSKTKPHNIFIESREKLNITGVLEVISFDENTIALNTELGGLILKGTNLHINKLNVDEGSLNIEGYIQTCNYTDKSTSKKSGGFLSNIFK